MGLRGPGSLACDCGLLQPESSSDTSSPAFVPCRPPACVSSDARWGMAVLFAPVLFPGTGLSTVLWGR